MYKKSMSALMGIILFVLVFVIVLAMYMQIKVYSQDAATSSTCSFTGSLRSFQNKGPVDLVTPETKLACQPFDYGELRKFGEDDYDKKNNYIKQVQDMMYDCANQFDFGKNNVWLREGSVGIHCFPCYSFYLPDDAEKISSVDMEIYSEQYEVMKEGTRYNMSDLLYPVLMPINEPLKDYFVSEVSMPWIDAATDNNYFDAAMIVVDIALFVGTGGTATALKKVGTEVVQKVGTTVAKNVARKAAKKAEKDIAKDIAKATAKKQETFYLKQALAEAELATKTASAEHKLAREALKKSKADFAIEAAKARKDAKSGVTSGMMFVVGGDYLIDNKGLNYETFEELEPKEDYVVVFISKVKRSLSSYEPGIGDDGNYIIVAKSKEFSRLNCQNEND